MGTDRWRSGGAGGAAGGGSETRRVAAYDMGD